MLSQVWRGAEELRWKNPLRSTAAHLHEKTTIICRQGVIEGFASKVCEADLQDRVPLCLGSGKNKLSSPEFMGRFRVSPSVSSPSEAAYRL
jgi:hypothetical protein